MPSTATEWGLFAAESGNWSEAGEAFDLGLTALNLMLPRQALRQDTRTWLALGQQLPALAAVTHVRLGDPQAAAVALEQGRFREITAVMQARRIRSLQDAKTSALRRRLDERLFVWEKAVDSDSSAAFERIIGPVAEEIRQLPGMSHFLSQPTWPDIRRGAEGQPLVYLAASALGMAVVQVSPDGSASGRIIRRVTDRSIRMQVRKLASSYRSRVEDRQAWNRALDKVGLWLGSRLRTLSWLAADDKSSLTLVPCGELARLPLLAAARLDTAGRRTYLLADRAITTALSARAHRPSTRAGCARIAVHVLGEPVLGSGPLGERERDLTDAEVEAASIASVHRVHVHGAASAPSEVLDEIRAADLVHFAAHGVSRPDVPMDSHIVLAADETRIRTDAIAGIGFTNDPAVLLPACGTGEPDTRLPDHSLDVATAFLHGGASEVIAPVLAIPRMAANLMISVVCPLLARGVRLPDALAHYRTWCRTTTDHQKLAHLRELADELAERNMESRQLSRCVEELSAYCTSTDSAFSTLPFWVLYAHFS